MSQQLKNLMTVNLTDLTAIEKYKLSVMLAKPKTFFETYFNNLPNARTCVECFNQLNDLHFEIFGEYMYTSMQSFLNQYTRNIKNRKH